MGAPHVRALGILSGRPAPAPGPAVWALPRPERTGDRFRRATRECLLALAAVDAMLEDGRATREAIAGDGTALLYVTAAAYGASNREFIERRGGVMHFAYTAPAVVPAEVAIEFGVTGAYGILIGGAPSTLRAIRQAGQLLDEGRCDRVLLLVVEIFEECADLYTRHRRFTKWPLVQTAACLWLERGVGDLRFESRRDGSGAGPGRADERLAAGPLADLREWLDRGAAGALELSGHWRDEHARLQWSMARSHARGSVA